jgi:hypothetical protein
MAPATFGAQLPEPCEDGERRYSVLDHWPRQGGSAGQRSVGRCLVEIAALPEPTSPFRWRLIAQVSNAYEVRIVNVLQRNRRGLAPNAQLTGMYYPNQWTPSVMTAAQSSPLARMFLGFSRFPAARSIHHPDGNAVVRWTDLRFVRQIGMDDGRQVPELFIATVTLNASGTVVNERLGN